MESQNDSNATEAKTPATIWTSQANSNLFADQSNYNYGSASEAATEYSPSKVQEQNGKEIIPANPLLPKVIHPE